MKMGYLPQPSDALRQAKFAAPLLNYAFSSQNLVAKQLMNLAWLMK